MVPVLPRVTRHSWPRTTGLREGLGRNGLSGPSLGLLTRTGCVSFYFIDKGPGACPLPLLATPCHSLSVRLWTGTRGPPAKAGRVSFCCLVEASGRADGPCAGPLSCVSRLSECSRKGWMRVVLLTRQHSCRPSGLARCPSQSPSQSPSPWAPVTVSRDVSRRRPLCRTAFPQRGVAVESVAGRARVTVTAAAHHHVGSCRHVLAIGGHELSHLSQHLLQRCSPVPSRTCQVKGTEI